MSERYTFAFRASLLLALLSSYAVYASGSGDGRDLGLIGVVFTVAIYWRDWRFKRFDLRLDLALERIKRERPLLFVFGNVVESQAPEKTERDVLLDMDIRKYRMHSVAAYWLLIGAIGFMILQRTNAFPFSFSLLLSFLIVSPLASASHLSHFLIPLGLSVFGVVVATFRSDEFAVGPLALFTFSVFSALCFYQLLKVTYFERASDRRDHLFATLKRASIASVGFILIVGIISKVFPKAEPVPQVPAVSVNLKSETQKPSQIARKVAQKIVEVDDFIRDRRAQSSADAPKDTEQLPGAQQSSANESFANGLTESAPSRSLSAQSSMKSGEMPQVQRDEKRFDEPSQIANNEATDRTKGQSAVSEQDLAKLRDELRRQENLQNNPQQISSHKSQGYDPKTDAKLLEQESQLSASDKGNSGPGNGSGANESQSRGASEGVRQAAGAFNKGEEKRQLGDQKANSELDRSSSEKAGSSTGEAVADGKSGLSEKAKTADTAKNVDPLESAKPESKKKLEEDKSKKVEALEKKIEKVITTFEKHSRFIMIVVIAGVLIILFSKYLASLKPKARSLTLSQKEKQALADQLRHLQKLKLTPQQEVIETYNIVMEILDRVELGREDGIPARIHMETLSRRLPRLGEPFINATDCFDHALYGEIEPDGQELVEFRQSTKKIFRQFDIAG